MGDGSKYNKKFLWEKEGKGSDVDWGGKTAKNPRYYRQFVKRNVVTKKKLQSDDTIEKGHESRRVQSGQVPEHSETKKNVLNETP